MTAQTTSPVITLGGGVRADLLVDNPPVYGGQGYGSDRTWLVSRAGVTTGKVRVQLHRDSYDEQSQFTASAWTPTGWAQVAVVSGHDPDAAGMPSYVLWRASHGARRQECVDALTIMETRLLGAAAAVLL